MSDDRFCLHCRHWQGTERDVTEQEPAKCAVAPSWKQWRRGFPHPAGMFADETCNQWTDARKAA